MSPADLVALEKLVGDDAIDFVMVLGGFHHINRVADLLHVDAEALPEGLRRFDFMRRLGVRMGARIMGRMDLENRAYEHSFEEVVARITPLLPPKLRPAAADLFAGLSERPKVVEAICMALEERLLRSTLAPAVRARVAAACRDALPRGADEATGFHPRPADPLDAFAFVGTRYPARVTAEMVAALRGEGFDDVAILDLAIAVADANLWQRLYRLLDLDPAIFEVYEADATVAGAA